MKVTCKFTFKYPSIEIAQKVKDALEVDNYKFVTTELENETLVAHLKSDSVMSLLHTTEDYLACLSTAEQVITQTQEELLKEQSEWNLLNILIKTLELKH